MTDFTPRAPDGRFGQGNPGRPRGARNRASRLAAAIFQDFEDNQESVLKRMRLYHAVAYMNLVTTLIPREAESSAADTLTQDDVTLMVARARAVLDRLENGQASVLELEAVVLGEPTPASLISP